MLLLLLELGLGIFGLVALIRGKIPMRLSNKKLIVVGVPARLLGLLAMFPPLVLSISVIYAFSKVKNGNLEDLDKNTEKMIDTINAIITAVTVLLVLGISYAIGTDPTKKKRKKRKVTRDDEDQGDDNRPWSKGREDDLEDEEDRSEPRRRSRAGIDDDDEPERGTKSFETSGVLLFVGLVGGGLIVLAVLFAVAFHFLRNRPPQLDPTGQPSVASTDPAASDFGGAWPGDGLPVGTNEVILHILGFPGRDGVELINERLDEIIPPGSRSRRTFVNNSRLSIFQAPIANADDFAKRINFGRVISVRGKIISIVCNKDLQSQPKNQDQASKAPSKHEEPPGDPVAQAIQDLKSNTAVRQKTGCDTLAGAQPDNRRAEVLPLLETLVNLPDLDLRYAATRAYCVWATRDNVPALIKLLNNEKYLPRMQFVMEALARLKDERGLAPISQWLGKQGRARSDSLSALITYGSAAEDHVIALLNTMDAEVRSGACEVLEQIGTRKCLPALEQAAMDSNPNIKLRAKRALDTVKKRL